MLNRTTYILLDAARMGSRLNEAKARNKTVDSLYRGTSSEKLAGVAPYIFQFAYGTPFANWYLKSGWGDSWGILLKSAWPMPELHKHFRKFLMVQTEDEKDLYFRFYDPRVLRIFLPTCDAGQIREFFGNAIDYFIVEDEDPAFALRFYHQNGVLQTERLPVSEEIARLTEPEPLPPYEDDELSPEAQEILKAAMAEHGLTTAEEQPAERLPEEAPVKTTPEPAPAQQATPPAPTSPKPKTKWNMFD